MIGLILKLLDDGESDALKQRKYDKIMEELGLFDYTERSGITITF